MDIDALAGEAVRLAGIKHEVERARGLLHRAHEGGRMLQHDIVVSHAMHQEQRVGDPARLGNSVGRGIGAALRIGIAQIALGIMGVIQLPFRNRRAGNARSEHARRFLQQLERHITAIGPAISGDFHGVHKGLRLQPRHARELILNLDRAHSVIDRVFERLAAIGRAAIVDGEDDPALLHQILLERPAP